jgi:chemotaxis protein methyltransferase CheR
VNSVTELILTHKLPKKISSKEFDNFCKLAYEHCGLNIEEGKEELVASRIGKVMRQLNIASFSEYYELVQGDATLQSLTTMIDSLTTNHTSFFREPRHFDFLARRFFPQVAGRSVVKIWSAACSTGEEPFSLAFAAKDFFGDAGPDVQVVATDISTRALDKARNAIYEASKVRVIPTETLDRHMLQGRGTASGFFRVKEDIRSTVTFQKLNLAKPFDGNRETFALVLCRNVMIYFDLSTQEKLVRRLHRKIEPGGYLFIGHSESLSRIEHEFEYICPAVYRKACY